MPALGLEMDEREITAHPGYVSDRIDKAAAELLAGSYDGGNGFADLMTQISELRCMVLATAIRNLKAVRAVVHNGELLEQPDGNVQMKAVAWISSYSDGVPTQTVLNINADAKRREESVDPEGALDAALASSPALREAHRRRLDRADQAAQKQVGP